LRVDSLLQHTPTHARTDVDHEQVVRIGQKTHAGHGAALQIRARKELANGDIILILWPCMSVEKRLRWAPCKGSHTHTHKHTRAHTNAHTFIACSPSSGPFSMLADGRFNVLEARRDRSVSGLCEREKERDLCERDEGEPDTILIRLLMARPPAAEQSHCQHKSVFVVVRYKRGRCCVALEADPPPSETPGQPDRCCWFELGAPASSGYLPGCSQARRGSRGVSLLSGYLHLMKKALEYSLI
jgi:hypothetical protein